MSDLDSTLFPGVSLQIDAPRLAQPFAGALDVDPGPGGCAFAAWCQGRAVAPPQGRYRRLHVFSEAAGGEIRAYELDESGTLFLAYPCHTGLWPEMDAEVARVLAT